MTSLQNKLRQIGSGLADVATCYHYWRPVKTTPCIIWAEDGEDSASYANNAKTEQAISGTAHLFTKTEYDPLLDDVQDKLGELGLAWALNSVQFEDETNLIHYEWRWRVANGETNS